MPPRPLALLVEAHEPGALNLCRAFREGGHEVTLLNRGARRAVGDAEVRDLGRPSVVVDLYDVPEHWRDEAWSYKLNTLGHKAARAGLGELAKPFLLRAFDARLARPVQQRVAKAVEDSGAEVVHGFWGVGSLPEQRALQLAGTKAALVHQFETYPLGKARFDAPKPASPLEQQVLGRLEGRIHASAQMEAYLDRALRPVRGLDAILPSAWGPWASARKRLPRLSEGDGKPHVAHIGVPPLRAGSYDDVAPQLEAIVRAGLAVHAVEGFRAAGVANFPRSGLRPLLTGAFAEFLTQFDAVALLYNAPPGLQWFAGNFPARFLSAVSAGVPVAVPRGLFGAVQEFVEREGNGLVFDGPADLAAKLRDEAAMANRRKLAEALPREHNLLRFLPKYEQFHERALDLRAGRPPGPSPNPK